MPRYRRLPRPESTMMKYLLQESIPTLCILSSPSKNSSRMTTSTSSIKLKSPADWHLWFSNLQAQATDLDLWEYIDPAGMRQLIAPEPVNPTCYKKVGQFREATRDDAGNEVL